MREKDATNGVHLNKHIYFQPNMHVYGQRCGYAVVHANNARIQSCNEWGVGTRREQDKDYNRLFIMYSHLSTALLNGLGATSLIQRNKDPFLAEPPK